MKSLCNSTIISILCLMTLVACKNDSELKVQELPKGKMADIIRNPLTANGAQDTTDVAKITFKETFFLFDTITEGEVIKHTFEFINDGVKPLYITEARSTCGCTVADYPEGIMQPGAKGQIKVQFNSDGRLGNQEKPVTVYANTLPQKTVVRIKGFVKPKIKK